MVHAALAVNKWTCVRTLRIFPVTTRLPHLFNISKDRQRVLLEYQEYALAVSAVSLLMDNRPYQVGMDTWFGEIHENDTC